jgi:hypothetical protein
MEGKMKEYTNKYDAILAAHALARLKGRAMYAIQWPLGHWTVDERKPSLRNQQMQVICCDGTREELA